MNITRTINKIYRNVIEANFPRVRQVGPDRIPFFISENHDLERQIHPSYRQFCGKDNKWFAFPAKEHESFWVYEVNLYELSLSDEEKFNSLHELKKHYENI